MEALNRDKSWRSEKKSSYQYPILVITLFLPLCDSKSGNALHASLKMQRALERIRVPAPPKPWIKDVDGYVHVRVKAYGNRK